MNREDLREGRRVVRGNMELFDLAAHIDGLGGIEVLDPDQLKRAEIALLVSPVNYGIEKYLADAFSGQTGDKLDAHSIVAKVSIGIGDAITKEISQDQNADFMAKLARARARLLDEDKAASVREHSLKILWASEDGVWSAYDSAIAARRIIEEHDPSIPDEVLVEHVKRSQHLISAWVQAPLEWNPHIATVVRHQIEGRLDTNLFRYDSERNAVFLTVPIEKWPLVYHPGRTIDSTPISEGPTGCPVSYDMKLVGRLYEHIVDEIEINQAW